jgi:Thiamine monophosphate kinase
MEPLKTKPLSEIGERQLVDFIRKRFNVVDDDVYVDLALGLMLKGDGFRLDYTAGGADLYDMGWKAVTSTVSDVLSKGGKPLYALISFGLPKDLTQREAESLLVGIEDACKYYDVKVVGGDTNEGNWIDVFVLARPFCYKPPLFVNSSVDLIITEPIGYTELIFNSEREISNNSIFSGRLKHPLVRKELINVFEEACQSIMYSTDVSDGLLVTLNNISRRLSLEITISALPIADEVQEKLSSESMTRRAELKDFLAKGGEDYVTVLVVEPKETEHVKRILERWGFRPKTIAIGRPGKGVFYQGSPLSPVGWDSFKGWT